MTKLYNVQITAEQMKQLGLKVDPFERADEGELYYSADSRGRVLTREEDKGDTDEVRHKVANYCTDKKVMEQRALHEILHRQLWRFSMQNGGDGLDWKTDTGKWGIYYTSGKWTVDSSYYSQCPGTVYFASEELAQQAIEEIIKPFIAECPDFEFGGCCL